MSHAARMSARHYNEEEIREILTLATELQPDPPAGPSQHALVRPESHAPPERGLTLAELEEVGRKAGIPARRIAQAAAELDIARAPGADGETYLGVPVTTRHAVRLPRMLTEEEWDRFVVRLRDTFDSTGEVRSEGTLQTWSDGTVDVMLEPLAQGARLRFRSREVSSKSLVDAGVALGVSGAMLVGVFGGAVFLTGKAIPAILLGSLAGMLGLGLGLWGLGRASGFGARSKRGAEFGALGAEARRIVGGTSESDSGDGARSPGPDGR